MVYKYEASKGNEIIVSGGLFADSEEKAVSLVYKKIRDNTKGQLVFSNPLKITLNGKIFEQGKLFDKPVYKKLQTRAVAPWKM